MQNKSKFGIGLAILVVALLLGVGWGLYLSRQAPILTPEPELTKTTQAQSPNNTGKTPDAASVQAPQPYVAVENTNTSEEAAAMTSTNWEDKLDDILLSDVEDATKADEILALIPSAPDEEAQTELAQHLVNMVSDEDYTNTAALLTDTNTPAAVSEVLMNDLLNRDNALKLPMLLALAKTPDHPLQQDAMDMLQLFIQDDKGTNWDEWQTAIDEFLKEENQENP